MKYNYITIYNDFFTKQIPFSEFQTRMDEYIKEVNPGELTLFSNHITDDSFVEYDPDMVMLTYLYLLLFPNKLTHQSILTEANNMYLTFIKSVIDSYPEDFKQPLNVLKKTFNYQIYERGNIIIIFNTTEKDINIPLPDSIKNGVHYCINCGDEIEFENSVELYPYGFYIIEK
jgi:hypothetical protein